MGNTVNRRIYADSNHTEIVGSVVNGAMIFNYGGSELSKRSEILEWISTIPYSSHHARISENRLEGTGEWIFEKEEYRYWKSSSVSMLLLLRGTPGAGKTYIASRVIDLFLSDPSAGRFAFFYCNRAEENRRNPEEILNALVQQLAQTSEANKLLKPVVDIYEDRQKRGQKSSRLSLSESQELLVQLTDIYPRTTICIDALDEVDLKIRLKLLNALKYVVKRSTSVVRFFTTARMDTDILKHLETFPRVELQPDDNVGDIHRFIEHSLQSAIDDLRLLHGAVSSELKAEICEVLRHRSKGMFQLAALQIIFLCEMCTAGDVRRSLTDLPDTLTEIYDEIYKKILTQSGSAPRLALNAFRWIQCSYEPIRTQTLLDAITVEIGDSGEFSRRDSIQLDDLLKACQNLIILDEGLNVFRFAHLSVDEYLETLLPRVDSHATIAKVCLSLLCTPGAWEDYDTAIQTKREHYHDRHLLLYSAVFWPWHFARFEDDKTCPILACIWDTFISGNSHQRWLDYHRRCVISQSIRDFWGRSGELQKGRKDAIFTVCVFGLERRFTPVFQSQSIAKSDLDQLLLKSCEYGDLGIARLLLDQGAEVSVVDEEGLTPLHHASWDDHESVARLLLDWRADIAVGDENGWTPLHLASFCGSQSLVRLLLDWGASTSTTDKEGLTPLYLAVGHGNEKVVRLLLDREANISVTDKAGRTPLHYASWNGVGVVRLLLDQGANISAADKAGRTPLHYASWNGDGVVRLLLDQGANISAADSDGRTPLHLASKEGRHEIVRLLLDQGADVSVVDDEGVTPLHLASCGDHESVARLLLDRNADVASVDNDGWTALHSASFFGCESVVRLLLDRGANISAANSDGQTPLHLALDAGGEEVVRLLLDKEADILVTDKAGRTPLHDAS